MTTHLLIQGESVRRPEDLPRTYQKDVFNRRVLYRIELNRKEVAA